MVSGTRAAHNIEVAAESLQEDLARLEAQKQALERELAAVVAHLDSVQRALGALRVLMPDPAAPPAPAVGATPAAVGPEPSKDVAPSGGDTVRRKEPSLGGRTPRPGPAAEGQRKYGKLTEQILEHFAVAGDVDLRARDVAAAIGRDTDSGTINAVRSTLDRLVGTSRIRRTGRGLYRAMR